jgi:hypothetical protein
MNMMSPYPTVAAQSSQAAMSAARHADVRPTVDGVLLQLQRPPLALSQDDRSRIANAWRRVPKYGDSARAHLDAVRAEARVAVESRPTPDAPLPTPGVDYARMDDALAQADWARVRREAGAILQRHPRDVLALRGDLIALAAQEAKPREMFDASVRLLEERDSDVFGAAIGEMVMRNQGLADEAFHLLEVTALMPVEDAWDRIGRAMAQAAIHRPGDALQTLDALIADGHDGNTVRVLRARALGALGHTEQARQEAEASLNRVFDPRQVATRALCYTQLGQMDLAWRDANLFRQHCPQSAATHILHAQLYGASNQPQAMLYELQQAQAKRNECTPEMKAQMELCRRALQYQRQPGAVQAAHVAPAQAPRVPPNTFAEYMQQQFNEGFEEGQKVGVFLRQILGG